MIHDREQHIRWLNDDLMGEHQAIVHYLTHAWTAVRQFGDAIEAIARDEMRHFKWLAHAIAACGGVPDLTPPDLLPRLSGAEALDYDIDAEEEAISQYLAHQRDIPDERIKALIGRIIPDERYHRGIFMSLRRAWNAGLEAETGNQAAAAGRGDETLVQRFQQVVSTEYQAILRWLLESFLARHTRQVGLDAEDRAIDEMKHMSWMAEAMADLGGYPRFQIADANEQELPLYLMLRQWAQSEQAALVPLIDRIISHEQYQTEEVAGAAWTVGSLMERGGR